MFFIGEAALSAFFEALFSKIASSDFNLVRSEQIRREIEKWDQTLKMIYAVLADAEGKQMQNQNQAVKIWLADLKDLAYDVDDILDEFSTKALERKLMKDHHQASSSKMLKLLSFGSTFHPSTIIFNNKVISKMRDITVRLESLAAQKTQLLLRDQNDVKGVIPRRPQSSSLVDETTIYGRQKDKEEILGMLFNNDDNIESNVSVIPIVGMGGMGKTTLAQLVYNDDSIKDHFDLKVWVCISDECDIVNITKTILLSVFSQPFAENDLNSLQVKLKEKLLGKKFLLVLDDVWNESYEDWMQLRCPFDAGAQGSKIIVTTRSSNVSSIMKTVPDQLLQKLSDDDSISMLAHHALGARDFRGHPELKGIGLEIMKKCDGLPLATKTVGGLLRTKLNREAWKDILESQIWNSDKSRIIPALWLSYYHLPSQLKQCFAYCSLIPKDYEFEKEEIIPLWMAEGFLDGANTEMSKEDLGRQCFEELVSRSFFQASTIKKSKFIMHDLINDLAQLVAEKFYSRMEENQQMKISRSTRHLSYIASWCDGYKKFQTVYEAKRVRTFLPFMMTVYHDCYLSHNVIIDLLPKLKYLRVLSLKGYWIYEIPDFIGNLKHLRYLDFSRTRIKHLPNSICTLYHLETLKLRSCDNIIKLPSNMGILVNLYHLDISGAYSIQKMPSGIGRLTNLQVLSNFIVGQGDAGNIKEMQDLSGLKGKLSISELQNVKEAQDAFEAKMFSKTGISDLKLEWSGNFDANLRNKQVEIDVLSFLKPHEELNILTISKYAGTSFPSWIADTLNLQSLTLEGCRNCTSLPAIGKLPHLKDLCIRGMNGVNSVGNEFYGENSSCVFPSLESLCFEDMPEWKEWKSYEVDEQGKTFHRLQQLLIRNCPKLAELFPMKNFSSLEELQIVKCQELDVSISTLPKLRMLEIDGCKAVVFGSYSNLCSLKNVLLSNISKFACEWLAPLESLCDLCIKNCPEVESVGVTKIKEEEQEGHLQLDIPCNIGHMRIEDCEGFEKISKSFQSLRCLSHLMIMNCGKLVSLDTNNLPPTLKHLEINSCGNLDAENMNFSSISILESLIIRRCKSLKSVSSRSKLPVRLKSLEICFCPMLEFVAQGMEDDACLESISIRECKMIKFLPQGLDKLSHLESIYIYNCPELECLPEGESPAYTNLKSLCLRKCGKLQALPNLYCLLQLQVLGIVECSRVKSIFSEGRFGLPTNLTILVFGGSDMGKAVMEWGLHRLNCLKKLYIYDSESNPMQDHEIEMKLPISLTCLAIEGFKNLRKIYSNTFQNLTYLQSLWISNCSKLKSLPKMEMLPSLSELLIWNCPELKKRCDRDKGKLWSNIAHIPLVRIHRKHIYEYE